MAPGALWDSTALRVKRVNRCGRLPRSREYQITLSVPDSEFSWSVFYRCVNRGTGLIRAGRIPCCLTPMEAQIKISVLDAL